MKLTITENSSIPTIKGKDIFTIYPGTFLKVIKSPNLISEINDFVIKTNDLNFPLVSIKSGDVWGINIEGYEFQKANKAEIIFSF